jgi:hypothetical protein
VENPTTYLDVALITNQNTVDTRENKKWIISQMNKVLEAYQNGLSSNKDKFESSSNDRLSKLATARNSFLSVIGIIITVIVSLATVDSIKDQVQPFLVFFLIGSATVGVFIYIRANYQMRQQSERLLEIEKAYQEGFRVQTFMKGFLGRTALLLEHLSLEQLYSLHFFYVVIQGGITKEIFDRYREDETRNQDGQIYQIIIDNAKEIYNLKKEEFQKEYFLRLFSYYRTSTTLFGEFKKMAECLSDEVSLAIQMQEIIKMEKLAENAEKKNLVNTQKQ